MIYGPTGPISRNMVVEYALSRSLSPAFVAEYQTEMPDKALLEAKPDEFYELARQQAELPAPRINAKIRRRR